MNKENIFNLGFDRNLNRNNQLVNSIRPTSGPVVYDTVNDRVSQLLQSGGTATSSIIGLPLSSIDPTQGYTGGSAL